MNVGEKEAYLREYEILKKKGKPFFPYAIAKDSAMMLIVALVLIAMSLILGAEQGPKADPTTTTYVPRPEWYFFFLFELLRVLKPPELVPLATIGIPTLCMVLLLLLPFYDRNAERHPLRRPVASVAGVMVIIAMAYLTFLGATAGSPTEIEIAVAPQFEAGKQVAAQSGCQACHKFGEAGGVIGPGPDGDRREAAGGRNRAHARQPVGGDAAVRQPAARRSSTASFSSSPRSSDAAAAAAAIRPALRGGGVRRPDPRHVRPHRRRLRRHEHGDDGGPAPRLARAGRRSRRARPGDAALDVACGTGDLAFELASRVGPDGHVIGSDFSERMLDLAAREGDAPTGLAGPLRVGRRARPALRRRPPSTR